MTEEKKTDIETLEKFLEELTEQWGRLGGVCYGGSVRTNGKQVRGDTACHAWVARAFYTNPQIFLLNCIRKSDQKRASIVFLRDWVAKKSVFSKYILNKDRESLKNGLILQCDEKGKEGLTQNEALWVCKVMRMATEGGQSPDLFQELVENHNVDPYLALFVAQNYRMKVWETDNYSYTGPDGHSSVVNTGYGFCFDSLVGLYLREVKAPYEQSNTGGLFFPSFKFKVPAKFNTDIRRLAMEMSRADAASDGWGGTVKTDSGSIKSFVKGCKDLEEKIRGLCPPDYVFKFDNAEVKEEPVEEIIQEAMIKEPPVDAVFIDFDF